MNKLTQAIIILAVILLLGLLFIGIPYAFVKIVNQTTERAIQPFSQANQAFQTQVSELMNPTPTIIPDPVTIIHEVRSLARLETIEYSVEKVITAEIGQGQFGFLFGDRLLFVAHGAVIAGVDLGKITTSDLEIKDGVLYVRLPGPEVFVATLDNEKSYVYDRETGLLTKGDVNLESEARKVAEGEIRKAALADGILDQARINAENYLERLLRNLGYQEIVFITPTPTP
ncbi:MAG: DUF4230 domain-containing protein [Anaerolineaceae bacterium]|nr:DUF4230 domain-containing protein [Anaerolineaceae bacterium]